jgi:AraC-like DNA-binding protein
MACGAIVCLLAIQGGWCPPGTWQATVAMILPSLVLCGIPLSIVEHPDVPEHAIAAFERMSGLAVCLHDQGRLLWSYLSPDRFEHLNAHCRAVKTVRVRECLAFESTPLYDELLRRPDGVVKVCHAGFLEWAVPMVRDGTVQWVLFAGVRRPAARLRWFYADSSPLPRGGPWAAQLQQLPAVDDEAAAWVLENLRQLNLRLMDWHERIRPGPPRTLHRSEAMRQSLVRHHARADFCLADLARELDLSVSRAGHAVQEACGQSFIELLTDLRLRTAAGLLRHTGLPLARVIAASGFRNRSHFHQVFRRVFGISPGRYRRRNLDQTASEAASPGPFG